MDKIYCRNLKEYKYQLMSDYRYQTAIKVKKDVIINGFIILSSLGLLTISKGYAWDGPSGPTFDTLNFMRGSLIHDALYQLMREGLLDHRQHRGTADQILHDTCRADGMSRLRAWIVLKGLTLFGSISANPKLKKPSIWAPKTPKQYY